MPAGGTFSAMARRAIFSRSRGVRLNRDGMNCANEEMFRCGTEYGGSK